tara:strand:- start:6251 stop:7132 length:882 start_codon:yes stop_codon:yes gene_type:complete
MKNTHYSFCHREAEPEESILYIVGTPIGNLTDFSPRAINILKKVSLIACEDTRTTKKLLNYFNIKNRVISLNQHNIKEKVNYLISELRDDKSIALVSDAGMPLISDPGELLVREVIENNLEAICVPGPCAALTALVSSGCSCKRFTFYGFLPRSNKDKLEVLQNISFSENTSIIYESPKRIVSLLRDLKKVCNISRKIMLTKELTKKHEEHIGSTIDEVLIHFEKYEPKGEFTLIVSGKEKTNLVNEESSAIIKEDLKDLMAAGLSHSAAAGYLAKKYNQSKNKIYNSLFIQN